MKWTKEQLIEGSLSFVRMKSKLALVEHKYESKKMRLTFHERMAFAKVHSPLRKRYLRWKINFY